MKDRSSDIYSGMWLGQGEKKSLPLYIAGRYFICFREVNFSSICLLQIHFLWVRCCWPLYVSPPKQDSFPMMSIEHAIQLMYPYTILLGHEGKMAVEGVLKVSTCSSFLPFHPLHFTFLSLSLFFLSLSFFFTLLFFLCLSFFPLPR